MYLCVLEKMTTLRAWICVDLGPNKKTWGLKCDMVPSQFFLLNRFFGSISYLAAILTGGSEALIEKYMKKADV